MSDTDSESEGDKIRHTRRSVALNSTCIESNSSGEDSANEGPSSRSSRVKRKKKIPSTDNDSDHSDANGVIGRAKRRLPKPYVSEAEDSSDTSWTPFDAAATAAGASVRTRPRSPRNTRVVPVHSEAGSSFSPKELVDELSDGGVTTDTSDDAIEKCPICLHSFRDQEIGTPNVCEHNYCAPCIDEWSRSVQTCPIDRKPFTKIRVRSCLDGAFVREVEVRAESSELKTDLDVTTCEICNLSDREDTMLLCDACDQGYHMECLIPPLTEIPEGSWYCDNCFGSDASEASEEDYAPLIEERDTEIGIPETRLRVRRVIVPRITRTRQSERILATIMSRRVRAEDAPPNFDMPGPSRLSDASTTTTRRRTTLSNRRRTTRRRRTAGRRRTYVVEYDIDNFDKKFQIKTARKVIRRRRRVKRRTNSRRGRCTAVQRMNNENDESASTVIRTPAFQRSVEANYPKLHLFGNKNALEYFPDENSDGDDGLDMLHSSEIRSGSGGTLVMAAARYAIGPNRNLLKRKGVNNVRVPSATITSGAVGTTDLLSNIMDTMDRWEFMTRPKNLEKIKFGSNGQLIMDNSGKKNTKPEEAGSESGPKSSDIVNAPRGGTGNDRNINFRSNASDFQNSNTDGNGNNGSTFSIGGNGLNSSNNSTGGTGYGYERGNPSSGGNGGDFNADMYHEPPRNRIITRRKSSLAPPPSIDNFPALATTDVSIMRGTDQSLRNRITTRRKSSLAPPPSLDDYPALNDASLASSTQNTPANVETQSGRVSLRRKSTLAPPPSLDEFPALSAAGLPTISENATQNNDLGQNQTAEPPLNRIMTRRRSMLAPPPSLDSFPALFDPSLPSTSENTDKQHETGTSNRGRGRRKATPTASSQSNAEVPNEACPPPPVPEIEGFDDNPIIDYSHNRTQSKQRDSYRESQPLQTSPQFAGYNHGSQMIGNSAPSTMPTAFDYSLSAMTGTASSTPFMPYSPASGSVNSNLAPQPVPAPVSFAPYNTIPTMVPHPSSTPSPTESYPIVEQGPQVKPVTPSTTPKVANKVLKEEASQPAPNKQTVDEPLAVPTPIDLNHKPTRITWKNNALKKKSIFSTSDDEDHDFQYSAESLEVAIKSHDAEHQNNNSNDKEKQTENAESIENDEDLVQMDDDDDDTNSEQKEASITESNSDKPEATEELDQSSSAKKNILDLHDDSDWEELNDDKIEDNDTTPKKPSETDKPEENENSSDPAKIDSPEASNDNENERSYTPCLDEQIHDSVYNADDGDGNHTPPLLESAQQPRDTGIDNMDTEMISDEDNDILRNEENNQKDGSKKSKRKRRASSKEKENDEEFRRISKSTRDRRYRDRRGRSSRSRSTSKKRSKSRSPSIARGRSRSRSRSKSRQRSRSRQWSRSKRFNSDNRNRRNVSQRFGRMNKRRELQRYNVRNVIFERGSRNQKDQYGRDEARPPRSHSHTVTPPRRRSPSHSSIGRRSPIRRSQSGSRSPYRRRRSSLDSRGSIRRSITPPRHLMRSPIRRTESPRFARYSRSPQSGEANGGRSLSVSPKHRGGKNKRKKRATEKKGSKRRIKRRKSRDRSVSNARSQIEEDTRQARSRSKSWNVNRWSRSITPPVGHQSNAPSESWTPPLDETNEDIRLSGSREKKRKRDKKKKSEKRRTEQRKEKRRVRAEQQVIVSNRPSKEVFASGDNILVSVSFNKEKATAPQQQTTIVTLPPSKDQIQSKKQGERGKKSGKEPGRKRKKLNVKPVAIIDLDNSPFKEMTPSPRAVIILSDSDHEGTAEKDISKQNRDDLPVIINEIPQDNEIFEPEEEHVVAVATSPPASPTMDDEDFEIQSLGPKTPPEPRIKFSLQKTKIRTVVNPLHDTADDQNDIEINANEGNPAPEASQTIQSPESNVPKSPSDTGPYSPDVYDPFEPTKSPSPAPTSLLNESTIQVEPARTDAATKTIDLTKSIFSSKTTIEIEDDPIDKENNTDAPLVSPRKDKSDDASAAKASIHVFSNILIAPAKDNIVRSAAPPPRSLTLFPPPATISPNKPTHTQPPKPSPMKSGTSLLSRLPMPPITVTKPGKPARHNGNDDGDGDSPYSPQSGDYDNLFDPPNASPTGTSKKSANRGVFDELFGSTSPGRKANSAKPAKRRHKKGSIKEWLSVNKQSTQMGYGKLSNDQIRILEDIPASAVELQAKDKYLRKLNRQERVVEEVKLILKPHYNKKSITKEEYKDIMRRAVPKICHNPTGEINPKKIKNLIEAYVKKFRYRRKGVAVAAKPN